MRIIPNLKTCCICGQGFKNPEKTDVLIYGCCSCCKGYWVTNKTQNLEKTESPYKKTIVYTVDTPSRTSICGKGMKYTLNGVRITHN